MKALLVLTASLLACGGGPPSDDGGAPIDSGIPQQPVAALPDTAFVFIETADAGSDHLMAYDFSTGATRTLSTLEGTTHVSRVSLSPDRTRVAFVAAFHVTNADLYTPGDGFAVWSMTVDGATVTRLTPTLPKPSDDGCRIDADCPNHEVCDLTLHHCFARNYNISRANAVWDADGKSVWFNLGQWSTDYQSGKLVGGDTVARAAADGSGKIDFFNQLNQGCTGATSPAISPDGTRIATANYLCAPNAAYTPIIVFSDPPQDHPLFNFDATDATGQVAWAKDGQSIFYVARKLVGQTLVQSIMRQPLSGGAPIVQYPGQPGNSVSSFTLSPDGTQGVVGLESGQLVWFKPDGTLAALDVGGKGWSPSW